ncbi:hypothetical protein ACFY7H_12920 [Streptomyces sp. NPDC012794]|uniref:hypothetical protein n=1 Tax=Streptomyces sp. NPDC012794 TaxID=3364850 RepID=UPI0036C9E99A
MTYRELASYVQGLPPHARTRTALREGRQEPNGEEILLADLFDMLQRLNWTLMAVNADKSKAPKPPKPYARWWLAPEIGKGADNGPRLARLEDARRRAAERKRQIEQGSIA